ncbi:unnamed protein product [Brassicogethes aeneus]|uniref:Protein kinase domain-containing protein n=1 Tax=Brassicogethes aeneus TaxID=1431903 RepID=A0A9P0BG76_BRAAE|nr:unnamed protein product [Brassicogethes aeneus]
MIHTMAPLVKDYILGNVIGNGGFSIVYKAIRKENNQEFALKYFKYKAGQLEGQRRVVQEVALLKILQHPNIIQMVDYNIKKTSLYIVFEYLECYGTLTKFNDEGHVNSELVLKTIMTDISSAIAYMHTMRIYHGDLKTDNVIVTDAAGPKVKLIDFGNADISHFQQREFNHVGSLFNMPPEVLRNLTYTDETSDAWALGILMYTLIYGHRPFPHLNAEQFKEKYRHGKFFILRQESKYSISEDARDLLDKLLVVRDNSKRLVKQGLMAHPFISAPFIRDTRNHMDEAKKVINLAFEYGSQQRFEDAFIASIQAIAHLNIFIGVSGGKDATMTNREFNKLSNKVNEYCEFTHKLNRLMNIDEYRANPIVYLRAICACSPPLLSVVDIGLTGEMYFKEGKREQAVAKLQEGVDEYLKLFQSEPIGERKEIVSVRVDYWLKILKYLAEGGDIPVEP